MTRRSAPASSRALCSSDDIDFQQPVQIEERDGLASTLDETTHRHQTRVRGAHRARREVRDLEHRLHQDPRDGVAPTLHDQDATLRRELRLRQGETPPQVDDLNDLSPQRDDAPQPAGRVGDRNDGRDSHDLPDPLGERSALRIRDPEDEPRLEIGAGLPDLGAERCGAHQSLQIRAGSRARCRGRVAHAASLRRSTPPSRAATSSTRAG